MNVDDNSRLEIEEPLSVQINEPASTKKNGVCLWLRRIVNLDDVSNQKHHLASVHHRYVHFTLFYSSLDIHQRTRWRDQKFCDLLYLIFSMSFVPCMRPAPDNIRNRTR